MKFKLLFLSALMLIALKVEAIDNRVAITEVMFDPEGSDTKKEWIEIHNTSDSDLDLSGWKLYESGVNHSLIFSEGKTVLKSHEFAVIVDDTDTFESAYSNFDSLVIDSSFSLSNTGEELVLKNNKGEIEHAVSYLAGNESESGYSLELIEDAWQKSSEKLGSPGRKNVLAKKDEIKKEYPEGILITELFPNPANSQYEEYIELFNNTEMDINLKDYILKDASKTGKFIFGDTIIKAKEYLAIFKKDFKFALNNSGHEIVTLFDPIGNEINKVVYDGSKQNASYNLKGDVWKWSKILTPGKSNIYNNEPFGKIKLPDEVYENVYANFSVSASDNDWDKIKITWDFGDKHKSYKAVTKHKYKEKGIYYGSLKISDGSEDVIKNFEINVKEFPRPKIRIVAINANPEGSDTENETITIENKSKRKINFKDWSIATGSSSKKMVNHPIREDFEINKKKSKEITRQFSSFSLNNKKGKIELRYPDGEIACKVKYEKDEGIEEGEIYQKVEGGWEWQASQKSIKSVKFIRQELESKEEKDMSLVNGNQSSAEMQSSVISSQSSDEEAKVKEINAIENKKENKIIELNNENIKIEILKVEPKVLGIESVRVVDEKYLMVSPSPEEGHYLIVLIKELVLGVNSEINTLLK